MAGKIKTRDKIAAVCISEQAVRKAWDEGITPAKLLKALLAAGGEFVRHTHENGVSGIFPAVKRPEVAERLGLLLGGIPGVTIQFR